MITCVGLSCCYSAECHWFSIFMFTYEYLRASGNNDGPSERLKKLYQDRKLLHQSPRGWLSLIFLLRQQTELSTPLRLFIACLICRRISIM
uniref:Uncharacterized protein n=1 Tax=Amphiprion percula TaxID=161767 RepID=A0A3P8TKP0_AMPPE